ncbi:Bug family tripartite tricarboxylate transporter substrate binding protein [Bordetella bronchialis]|uniref:Bug family tripartite tricarboxylate transporter substrate binding protein n=1 Tax=Bordetella bronchialis TaxID=463025 RepID=UPI003D02F904
MKIAAWITGCLVALGAVAGAQAADWPDKPVNLIVPYPAGGGVDPVARLVGQKLSERWGQPVVVQNKAGASGSIGAAYVARAKPDGTTIMMSATAEVVINQYIMQQMPYDPEKDLVPVTLAVRLPFVLVTQPNAPYSNVAELLAYAKKHPGGLTYASSGNGTPQHLAAVLLEQLGDVKLTHIPYKGVAPSISALLGGEVNIGFVGLPTGLPHIQSGQLKALAVSGPGTASAAPDIAPVARTQGLEKFDLTQWFGVFVPAGTPDDVVQRIQQDVATVLQMPDVRKVPVAQGAEPSGMPTAEFRAFVEKERNKFSGIVKAGNL